MFTHGYIGIYYFAKLFTDGISENELHCDDKFVVFFFLFQHLTLEDNLTDNNGRKPFPAK